MFNLHWKIWRRLDRLNLLTSKKKIVMSKERYSIYILQLYIISVKTAFKINRTLNRTEYRIFFSYFFAQRKFNYLIDEHAPHCSFVIIINKMIRNYDNTYSTLCFHFL